MPSGATLPYPPTAATGFGALHRSARALGKRTLDCALAVALLAGLMPLLLLVGVAIRLDGFGPALFRQTRIGRDGRAFTIFKFRTMRTGGLAPLAQATPADPRVTRIGRVLRRTSLDELPQLWNVLRGDMALVGPRPHAPGTPAGHAPIEWTPGYAARHAVRPGLTGLAQVRGLRGQTDTQAKAQARLASDLEYVRTWSVRKDVAILARTALVVVRGDNAV